MREVFVADAITESGKIKFTFQKIDLKDGKITTRTFSGGSFNDHALKLLEEVVHSKPIQIIFDKRGIGMGLFDSFISCLNKYNTIIEMKENGELIYND